MNQPIKILFFTGLVLLLSPSCEYTNLDLLDNPNEAALEQLDIEFLYNNIQLGFKEFFEETWALAPLSRMGHVSAFRYEEAFPATVGDAMWTQAYSGILPDIELLENQDKNKNITYQIGTAKILKAYILFSLVDIFGDVPLSDLIEGVDEGSPQSRSGEFVYETALGLLDEAVEILGDPLIGIPDNDLYYEGKRENWIALANTLKIRAYLNTRLLDDEALSKIEEIQNTENIIDEASEDFEFRYSQNRVNPNSRHPFYNAAYESSPPPYLSNYYMWLFIEEYDPRARYYFNRQAISSRFKSDESYACFYNAGPPNPDNYPEHFREIDPNLPYCVASDILHYGRDHMNGSGVAPDEAFRTVYGTYPAGGKHDNTYTYTVQNGGIDGFPESGLAPILQSSFTQYMLAETKLLSGKASEANELVKLGYQQSFEKAIKYRSFLNPNDFVRPGPFPDLPISNFEFWQFEDFSSEGFASMLEQRFEDASSLDEKLDILGKEYLKTLWGNALDAYNLYRRTTKPANMQPALLVDPGDFPRTLLYPSVHVNRNKNVNQKVFSTPVFWDTNDGNIFQR